MIETKNLAEVDAAESVDSINFICEQGGKIRRASADKINEKIAGDVEVVRNQVGELKSDLESIVNNMTITKKSKNLFDNSEIIDNTRAGLDEGTRAGCKCSQWIEVVTGTTYTLSNAGAANCVFAVGYKNADGTVTSENVRVGVDTWYTFTVESGIYAVQFGPFSVENASKITTAMLEVGDTRTDYEPYCDYRLPNDTFFPEYKTAYDSIFNGQSYDEGASLVIEEMTDGKPTKFGYKIIKAGDFSGNISNIIEHGKNLYNCENDTFGKYADETGGQTLQLRRSEFIQVEPNTDYFITGSSQRSFNIMLAEFSGNTTDSLIQSATMAIPKALTNIKLDGVKITTSSTTKYIRFSTTSEANNDYLKDFMIIKGTYAIHYEPYYEFAKYDPLHPVNPWRGKRLWVDGDSITHAYAPYFWQFNVARALDMILDTTVVGLGTEGYADGWKGIGGSTISNEAGNNDPEHSVVLRYMNYPDNGIDLVIIAAGTNDWGHGNTLLGDFDSMDDTTFNGALNILLPALKEKYPTIPVVMMTPIKRGVYKADNVLGLKLEDFVDALIVKCRQYGIYCCDMYANCPIDPNITSMQNVLFTRTSANGSKDLVHPGEKGHEVMGRTVVGFVRGIS